MRPLFGAFLIVVPVVVGCSRSVPDSPDYYPADEANSSPSSTGTDEVNAPPAASGDDHAVPTSAPSEMAPDATDGGSMADAGADGGPKAAPSSREAAVTTVYTRRISLHLDDADGTGWATIENGSSGDEVWLDRSFDGGAHYEGMLGVTAIPTAKRSTQTAVYATNDAAKQQKGQLRACGKAGDRTAIACTAWHGTQ
jgi:hypothetical protein